MKYWNKDKRIRQERWYRVQRDPKQGYNFTTIKRELQLHDSPGKFYLYYGSTAIWFERSEDAMWFSLSML